MNYDDTIIEVSVQLPGREEARYRHHINRHEAQEFALRPIHRPLPGDHIGAVEYGRDIDRRRKHAEMLGQRIAFDFMRFLEERESD